LSPDESRPPVLGVVSATARGRALAHALAEALAGRQSLRVVTDRAEEWRGTSRLAVAALPLPGTSRDRSLVLKHWLRRARLERGWVVIDLAAREDAEELSGLLLQCEKLLWVTEPEAFGTSDRGPEAVLRAAPGLAKRLHLVWVRRRAQSVASSERLGDGIATPDFRIALGGDPGRPTFRPVDLARLVRYLRGTSIALALGGGGARGSAHVGVLRAFARAGVPVDMISGSSMGAFVGLSYADGYRPDAILTMIQKEMAAPRALRALPGGSHWYMCWMYRSGGWRRKAQRFFPGSTFERLDFPLYLVTTDLVTGKYLVRERGDVVEALLESTNFPGMARPILRDGAALVDGGVLNNVPSNVLRARGAQVVVAVDVARKIKPRFGRNDPSLPTHRMRRVGLLETLLRVIEVQQRALIAAEEGAADLVIAPEVMSFGFTDYQRAAEMADLGEAAAEKTLPALKRMLKDREQQWAA
jgi:predicted acylesterase/phospholipase RssA